MLRRGDCLVFYQHSGGDIAKYEVAVTIAPVEVTRGNLWADHQHALCISGADVIGRGLDSEGRRRACDIHVEAKTVDPQCLLDLDCHCGIGPLHIRGGAEHSIDIRRITACPLKCLESGLYPYFRKDRDILVGPFLPTRCHDIRIEDRRLGHDMACLNPARLLDEFDRTRLQGLHLARLDRCSIGSVEALNIAVEAFDELFIGDAVLRGKQPGGRYDGYAGEFHRNRTNSLDATGQAIAHRKGGGGRA